MWSASYHVTEETSRFILSTGLRHAGDGFNRLLPDLEGLAFVLETFEGATYGAHKYTSLVVRKQFMRRECVRFSGV